jgi:hypothetical protein
LESEDSEALEFLLAARHVVTTCKKNAMSLKLRTAAAFAAYSFTLEPGVGRTGFIAALLSANVAAGARCALLTPLSPQQFMSRCNARRAALFHEAIGREQLLIFTMVGDYDRNIFRFGPEKFLCELKDFGLQDESLLVVDQAESLFSLHDRELALEQLSAYQEWLKQTRSTALLLFSHAAEQGARAGSCQTVVDNTRGSARLVCERGVHEIWVDFWHPAEETKNGRRIVLEPGDRKKSLQEAFSGDDAKDLIRELTKTSR